MSKVKTNSGAKKRFRVTASGLIKAGPANKRHGMTKRPQKMIRSARGPMILKEVDAKIVKQFLPYA